jgi:hypothetical protein
MSIRRPLRTETTNGSWNGPWPKLRPHSSRQGSFPLKSWSAFSLTCKMPPKLRIWWFLCPDSFKSGHTKPRPSPSPVLRRIRTLSRGRRSAKVVEGWPTIRTESRRGRLISTGNPGRHRRAGGLGNGSATARASCSNPLMPDSFCEVARGNGGESAGGRRSAST